MKTAYRRFNIDGITPGDDYAALKQAVGRRYTRIKDGEAPLPDVLFIDGGRGQLSAVGEALDELEVHDLCVVGVAKGPTRRPGMEELIMRDSGRVLELEPHSPALHLIQRIRDEAHRFAISFHRDVRSKNAFSTQLTSIQGIGENTAQKLLKKFKSVKKIKEATKEDIIAIIGKDKAEKLWDAFHQT